VAFARAGTINIARAGFIRQAERNFLQLPSHSNVRVGSESTVPWCPLRDRLPSVSGNHCASFACRRGTALQIMLSMSVASERTIAERQHHARNCRDMISLAGWLALDPCGVAVEAHLGRNLVLLLAGLVGAIARWRGLVVLFEIRIDNPLGSNPRISTAREGGPPISEDGHNV
jgi:hypothetical protein